MQGKAGEERGERIQIQLEILAKLGKFHFPHLRSQDRRTDGVTLGSRCKSCFGRWLGTGKRERAALPWDQLLA